MVLELYLGQMQVVEQDLLNMLIIQQCKRKLVILPMVEWVYCKII